GLLSVSLIQSYHSNKGSALVLLVFLLGSAEPRPRFHFLSRLIRKFTLCWLIPIRLAKSCWPSLILRPDSSVWTNEAKDERTRVKSLFAGAQKIVSEIFLDLRLTSDQIGNKGTGNLSIPTQKASHCIATNSRYLHVRESSRGMKTARRT
ncbi:MAG: hypothetical protein DMG82_10025, partial [Acidobacteria bacterium]